MQFGTWFRSPGEYRPRPTVQPIATDWFLISRSRRSVCSTIVSSGYACPPPYPPFRAREPFRFSVSFPRRRIFASYREIARRSRLTRDRLSAADSRIRFNSAGVARIFRSPAPVSLPRTPETWKFIKSTPDVNEQRARDRDVSPRHAVRTSDVRSANYCVLVERAPSARDERARARQLSSGRLRFCFPVLIARGPVDDRYKSGLNHCRGSRATVRFMARRRDARDYVNTGLSLLPFSRLFFSQ